MRWRGSGGEEKVYSVEWMRNLFLGLSYILDSELSKSGYFILLLSGDTTLLFCATRSETGGSSITR